MNSSVYVVGVGALSAVAGDAATAHACYARGEGTITRRVIGARPHSVAALCASAELLVSRVAAEPAHRQLDRTVRLGLCAARAALQRARLRERGASVSVILASSRGCTHALERHHGEYLMTGETGPFASPTTTLGSLASTVARELTPCGLAESLSSACTSSLHALALGVGWLRAGLSDACLVGGAEAPLTPFTLAQFRALGLLGDEPLPTPFPCRPLALEPPHPLVLGEGACVLALERLTPQQALRQGALAEITGLGACVEKTRSLSGITPEGDALAHSMTSALAAHGGGVDAVVVHAPGTKNGDAAELAALRRVFGRQLPALCSNKWQLGHTFGASGALGVEFALALLAGVRPAAPPFASALTAPPPSVKSVMINAAGFGGSAVSVVLRRIL